MDYYCKSYLSCVLIIFISSSLIRCQTMLCDRSFMGHVASGVLASQNFPLNYSASIRTCSYKIYSSNAQPCDIFSHSTRELHSDYLYLQKAKALKERINATPEDTTPSTENDSTESRSQPGGHMEEELVCFKFHRFRLRKGSDYLEFSGKARYRDTGKLSYVETPSPENVFVDNFCWPIPQTGERYLEVLFSTESKDMEYMYTEVGFYATFTITKRPREQPVIANATTTAQTLLSQAPCADDSEFMCFDRTCIPRRLTCNGAIDCPDASDETYIHARCAGRQSYAGCDFELTPGVAIEHCGFSFYNWVRDQESHYGPRYDHTIGSAFGPGNFTYTMFHHDKTELVSRDPSTAQLEPADRCFRFWYFMSGEGIGSLNVFINNSAPQVSQNTSVWTRRGNSGMNWHMGEVDLPRYITKIEQIVFEGIVGGFREANIALDDISLTEGKCFGDDISCTFELGTCSWESDRKHPELDTWTRKEVSELEIHQGPPADCSNNANGYFMYFNSANSTSSSTIARIVSKPVSEYSHNNRWCISFCYFIQKGKGRFKVKIRQVDMSETLIFWDNYEQGWYTRQINIGACKPIQVILDADATLGHIVVGVDDIIVSQASCNDPSYTTTAVTKATTTTNCEIQFCCKDGIQTIDKDRVCDGRFDCDDKSDEQNCNDGGISVLGIVAIIGGILLVMIVILFHLLWTVKRRMSRQANRRVPRPRRDSENLHVYDEMDSPIGYGDPPPPYSEQGSESGHSGESTPGNRPVLTISLRWEPPPAYDIAIVGVPRGPEHPPYSPRIEPPPFDMVGRDPYHVNDDPILPPYCYEELGLPESSTDDQISVSNRSHDINMHSLDINETPIVLQTQTPLAGVPELGNEVGRYFTCGADIYNRPQSNDQRQNRPTEQNQGRSLRRSFRRFVSGRKSFV